MNRQCPNCSFRTLTRVALTIHMVVNNHAPRRIRDVRNAPEVGRWRFRNPAKTWDAMWLFFAGGLIMVFAYLHWSVYALDTWAQDPVPLIVWALGFGLGGFGFMIGMREYDRMQERVPYTLPAEDLIGSASPERMGSTTDASARQWATWVAVAPQLQLTIAEPTVVTWPEIDALGFDPLAWPRP